MKNRLFVLAGIAALLFLVGSEARADTVYPSRAAFNAAVPGATVETFDGVTAPFTIPNGTAFNGVVYTSNDGNPLITAAFLPLSPPNTLGEDVNGFFVPSDTITFTFASPMRSFGISINTFDTSAGGYLATDNAGHMVSSFYDPFPGSTTGEFVGYSATIPFTSVTISAPGGFSSTLDNLEYSPNGAIPEPATLGLAGLGVLSLVGYHLRRRRGLK